jgi:kojibiose phosphorylase
VFNRLWTLTEYPFQPERQLYYETIFCIGNGYLGSRASFEEGYPGDMPATLVHGVYNHAEDAQVPELANIPHWLGIEFTVDGTPFRVDFSKKDLLKPAGGVALGYQRTLDMQHGLLKREALFRAESGGTVRVTFERFASMDNIHLMVQRVTITAIDGSPEIRLSAGLHADVDNEGRRHWKDVQTHATSEQMTLAATTTQSGYRVALASALIGDTPVTSQQHTDRVAHETHFKLGLEESVTLLKLTAITTSRDTDDPLTLAQSILSTYRQQPYDQLVAAHAAQWERLWNTTDILIEGDEEAQVATRFCAYHILIAAPRHTDDVSVGAKTLSGFGYKGHVFWDTELFVLPPLTLTQPQIARNLLMYRYHRLEGARNKAKENGYEGAMFPWESTDTGEETTPKWSDPQPDGTRIRIWTGDNEQHISTDIAYAVLQYWRWTGDDAFLIDYGAEIVLDTAVFWGSRVEERNGRYELTNQIGPDEYHENIPNSVFVNRMTQWHLQQALKLLAWLKQHAPQQHARLSEQLKLTPERLAKWQDIIDRMYIPFDDEKQIHVQFDGFFDLEYIPVLKYEPRVGGIWPMLGHERALQSQVIKQADVVMMMALLGEEVGPREVMVNNFNTYYPRTDHGSSLSPAMHAWVAARLGLDDIAYHMFQHAAWIDLKDNKGNVRDGIHAAACGGLWQSIVFGFCGLHFTPEGDLAVDPHLPAHWKQVSFSVYYRGERRTFTVEQPALVAP